MFKFKNFKSLFPYFLLAVAVIIAYYAISEVRSIVNTIGGAIGWVWGVITPFFYGFIIAYILHIPFEGLQNLIGKIKWKFISKRKKLISLIIVLIGIALIIFAISYLVIPAIYNSVLLFIGQINNYYDEAKVWLEYFSGLGLERFNIDLSEEKIVSMAEEWLKNFSSEYVDSPFSLVLEISSTIFGVGSAIFTGFLAFISSIYFLMEKEKIKYFLCRLLVIFTPVKFHDIVIKYGGKFNKNCKQYLKTQTIDGLIIGTITTVALLIMGSPYALLIGIMLAILNYIPYFGSIIGTVIAVVIVAFTQDIVMGLIAAAVLLVAQQIDGNIIQPKLMGGSFKISPLLVIISVIIGQTVAGVFGMLIAIPVVGLLKDIFEDIIKNYEERKSKKAVAEGGPPDKKDNGTDTDIEK